MNAICINVFGSVSLSGPMGISVVRSETRQQKPSRTILLRKVEQFLPPPKGSGFPCLVWMNDAAENIEDFDPISAEFDIDDGKQVIRLYGENRVVTAIIPSGIYDHLTHEFAEALANDNSYVVDSYWAMDAMGIDPYDDYDCDGDCENCPHNCDDDFDEDECDYCERDCTECDCLRCEEVFDDGIECDGDCENCHGCNTDDDDE